MSTDKLLTAMNAYLGLDQALMAAHANDPSAERLRRECDAARRSLKSDLQAYAEQRSRPGMVKSILVAVDDSEPAQWAVDEAVRLGEGLDARVSLVHVIDVAPALGQGFALDDAMKRPALVEGGRAILDGLKDRIPVELRGEQILREGHADKQIIAAAHESRAGLVVIGTHGRGLLGRFLLGSVAEAVVRHAPCPVLAVGHPRQGAAPEPYAIETSAAEAEIVQGT